MLKCINLELEKRKTYLKKKTINTIYFGGGTPSILNKKEIKAILEAISKIYKTEETPEITLECNPDDLTENKLKELKEAGINRLSIGIQSFYDEWQKKNHNKRIIPFDILSYLEETISKKRLIANHVTDGYHLDITIDLIYGLPNQNLADWEENLKKMFASNINHFSAYALTVENKTPLKHLIEQKKIIPLSEEKVLEQFNALMGMAAENGFVHYEISNFGKPGYFSKHNTAYWENTHYLGIGPSAHSFNGKSRRWNVSSNKKYIQKIAMAEDYFETELTPQFPK